jgi:release factor glutamine methyltransferase
VKYFELLESFRQYDCEESALIFLLTEICKISRSELYLKLNDVIDDEKLIELNRAIEMHVFDLIPVQYILEYTYFYGLKFLVNKNVLIPRFDTEVVVDEVIKANINYKHARIIDVCTGTGCIAIATKVNIPDADITAIEISTAAIEVAKENAKLNKVDINFIQNDLLENINGEFDIIVSNPPYIDIEEDVMSLVTNNEPHLALYSPEAGLFHYRKILEQSKSRLSKTGVIIFEIAYNKRKEMIELVEKYYSNYEIIKDLNNNDRIMIIR